MVAVRLSTVLGRMGCVERGQAHGQEVVVGRSMMGDMIGVVEGQKTTFELTQPYPYALSFLASRDSYAISLFAF